MPKADRPVLVLGATGTSGRRVVTELTARGASVRAASRTPTFDARAAVTPVRFEWDDPTTHRPALDGAGGLYVIAPAGAAPADAVLPLLKTAEQLGIERIVVLSASAIESGDAGVGQVHAALPGVGVDWAVLRPSWFMQNLWNPSHHLGAAALAGDELVTATGAGRVGFIDANDIAAVACHALLDKAAPNADLILTGPDALSYDDAVQLMTRVTGQTVRHRAASTDESVQAMTEARLPQELAEVLGAMEASIAGGREDRLTDAVERITGRPPRGLEATLVADAPLIGGRR